MAITNIKELNIIICGVGGQGIVSVSELLGNAAIRDGQPVKGSEVLGMAQRGGSVLSNIRIGEDAFAPLIPETKSDLLLAVEPSEVLHYLGYVNKDSLIILNTHKVVPYTVALGHSIYPEIATIIQGIKAKRIKIIELDADRLAKEAGDQRTTSVVMLGALLGSGRVPISVETVKAVISEHFPNKVAKINCHAFDLGYKYTETAVCSPSSKTVLF
ncbi:indolepyruvate oxidoreductase subunit beta [Chloroflexota bacterium]